MAEVALREASPRLRLFFLVVTELPWGEAERAKISRPLAALNRTARGAGRVHYTERVGGDPLEAFAHLVAADVLVASDSHFSIAAAQLSFGVQLRIRRQGFAAVNVQQMIPLPLMGGEAEARARVRVNRNRGCAEDEAVLAARSGAIFGCRLNSYLKWRAALPRQLPVARPGGTNCTGGRQQCIV